jgi:Ni/Fe-hydrogenase subunit HybB-like protein
MLGYTFVVVGLLADLGRYYNVWHPILPSMWQGNSVLFEVGMCVMIYLAVLYIEFLPIVVERFRGRVRLPGPLGALNGLAEGLLAVADRTLSRVLVVFILAGVVLSCLHQSSLGTLMVIAPTKMHPLWYTPLSPLLFLVSAIAVGFPMVIFESLLASRSFRLKPEIPVLSSLARAIPVLLGIYLALKVGDLTLRGAWPHVAALTPRSIAWLAEMIFGVFAPMLILSSRRLRGSAGGLFAGSTLVILGVALNRINVFLVAYRPPYAHRAYVPSVYEVLLTAGLIAALVLAYRLFVMTFPVVSAETAGEEPHASGLSPARSADSR